MEFIRWSIRQSKGYAGEFPMQRTGFVGVFMYGQDMWEYSFMKGKRICLWTGYAGVLYYPCKGRGQAGDLEQAGGHRAVRRADRRAGRG